ncbi:MAG: hypothetical protein IJX47_02935 [Clostridia bacterium]|nr:hypothetical protein [Clostridia bacterium]
MEYASNAKGNAALTTGIIGTAGVGLGLLGNLLGMNGGNCPHSACSENTAVNRFELSQETEIATLKSHNALLEANIYGDQKLLEVYKYFDGKIEGINQRLAEQAVWNATQTGTISCMAGQIAQLMSLTKLVVPNTSVCPGWGNVTITPATAATA